MTNDTKGKLVKTGITMKDIKITKKKAQEKKIDKVVKKALKIVDKIIIITLSEGKRGTATFSENVRGHDVDVAGMRLKRMYRVYREQQRRKLKEK